ncbi:ADP-ribosylation factor-like protein 2 [Larimichthys crocea]|uniref:Uncharacterized protein n=1 Tax=Larimichthys crocea TaxID=215358 RepID=A0ACD3Q4I6_LARCR|nr:ADP-ribosylation factor-like protein 2 [Larimichthys crocea]
MCRRYYCHNCVCVHNEAAAGNIRTLGLDNAGKTTILKKFNGEGRQHHLPDTGLQHQDGGAQRRFRQTRMSAWKKESSVNNFKTFSAITSLNLSCKRSSSTQRVTYESLAPQPAESDFSTNVTFTGFSGSVHLVTVMLNTNSSVCVSSRFKLNIWDVGGQKSLRSYWKNYFESTDGLRLAGATLLVFANKQDLPGALSKEAIREALALDKIKSHHWCIIGCSAVTGENLLTGVDWLLDDIAARIFTTD